MRKLVQEQVGERLRVGMNDAGLSENALAERMGITQSTFNAQMNKNSFSLEVISRAAQVLGVRTDWLLLGEGPKWRSVETGDPFGDGARAVIAEIERVAREMRTRYATSPAAKKGVLLSDSEVMEEDARSLHIERDRASGAE